MLRHAKAAPEEHDGDAARPLVKRGREAATAMGVYLGSLTPAPELALCSAVARARETLELVLPALHPTPRVLYETGLYMAEPGRLLERLQRLPVEIGSVLLVGHNPGLQQLASRLAPDGRGPADGFPTASLAVFHFAGAWSALRPHHATLASYRTPKALSRDLELE